MSACVFGKLLPCSLPAALVAALAWDGSPAVAQSFMHNARCGVFYDRWVVAGAPATTLATVGMAHESFAARDCLARHDVATACEHYRNVLTAIDAMEDDAAGELRSGIETQMAEIACAP